MSSSANKLSVVSAQKQGLVLTGIILLVVLAILFFRSFLPGHVLFSNDGPLGHLMAEAGQLPGQFTGYWMDLNWVGGEGPSASPSATSFLRLILGNVVFLKFYAPLSLFCLGLVAAWFARRLGANWPVATLVGLAAALNGNYFSNACWGLGTRALTLSAVFLALAAFTKPATSRARNWAYVFLAGAALGFNIMEGYDVGAIFSLYVAAYILYTAWIASDSPLGAVRQGVPQVLVVALVAAWVSTHTLSTLVGTQVAGRAGMEQTPEVRQQRWDWATQWSLPKSESLRIIVPGLFGYRMDTPEGGQYWGRVGQQPGWEEHRQGMARHSGAGEYGGLLVVLIAAWTVAQGMRTRGSPFQPIERRLIAFWAVAGAVSLLLAFGRHAPFYQLIYNLPFFSTIRAPIKFMYPFHLSLLVLMAYGLIGMSRTCLGRVVGATPPFAATLQRWWSGPPSWERTWVKIMIWVAGFSVLMLVLMAASRPILQDHLTRAGFSPEQAVATSGFVMQELLLFLVFFALSSGALAVVLSGALQGARTRWAWIGLGLLITVDLGRANLPWIVHVNYPYKYASNPVVDFLRERPFEHRVQVLPFGGGPALEQLRLLYGQEWLQHLFPFYNVQSLDIVMEPRVATDDQTYRAAFTSPDHSRMAELLLRKWELTNARFFLGLGGGFDAILNQQLDPIQQRFRMHTPFMLIPKREPVVRYEDVTARLQSDGAFGLLEFTGALPRYSLYTNWQAAHDDTATLTTLTDPRFNPHQTVLVQGLDAPPSIDSEAEPGTILLVSYHPKHLVFEARVQQPSVFLLNDKYHPDWRATLNGQPATIHRANFLMRAVHLPPGEHQVEFLYRPGTVALYISLAGIVVALGLCAWLAFQFKRRE
jgi:hypothetical protein